MSSKFVGKIPPTKLVALVAQQNSYCPSTSPTWIADSGATHHVSHDISNFSTYSKYEGSHSIYVANGEGLPIFNTSSTSPHKFKQIYSYKYSPCSLYASQPSLSS